MRIIAVFLSLSACVPAYTEAFSQKVTLRAQNLSLQEAFSRLEAQTGYFFIYTKEALQGVKNIKVDIQDQPLSIVLDTLLKPVSLSYRYDEKYITIVPSAVPDDKSRNSNSLSLNLIDIRGKVVNEKGEPVVGASVKIKGTDKGTNTNDNGEFMLTGMQPEATIQISAINIETSEVNVNRRTNLIVTAQVKVVENEAVVVNTGYQQLPKERASGSFTFIDNELLNRRVSTNLLDRLEGVASGLLFNKNAMLKSANATTIFQANQSVLTIRGRSTINSNPNSLIVVDNFPYDGDMGTINPNDVESITILKDAAAASIWGAFSGNGVIVITTKKGKYNQAARVQLNSNITIAGKPDLYYQPGLSSSDYIDIEQYLYNKGFYSAALSNAFTQLSPVVAILAGRTAGTIDSANAEAAINAFRNQDIRTQLDKYVYQKAMNQQYVANLSGGGGHNRYFLSAGFDHNKQEFIGDSYRRASIRASNTIGLLKQKLEVSADLAFAQSADNLGNFDDMTGFWPYIQLADANGKALIIPKPVGYRKSYTDTAGKGLFLDWNFRPLDEIRIGSQKKKRLLTDYHINLSLRYKIIAGLDMNLVYQYNEGTSEDKDYYSQEAWYTRNLINSYSQVNFAAGTVFRPIPLGGILDRFVNTYKSRNLRGQVNYSRTWNNMHEITALVGAEVREYDDEIYSNRVYGYSPEVSTVANVDYTGLYPNYVNSYVHQIPTNTATYNVNNNYLSFFANAGYTYGRRYILTASIRRDESNLFGVKTNQKGVPLWSAGLAWSISNEKFYSVSWLPYLKLRLTNGCQGNVNTKVAALTTAAYAANNPYGAAAAYISNLPNASLRWEKVNQANLGIDFGTKNNRISGSFDYYIKKGTDLIALNSLDPTTGSSTFTGNTAEMKAHGVDLILNTKNLDGGIKWNTNFLFNLARDKVTTYYAPVGTIANYLNPGFLNPLIGRPLYSLYSFRWAGLDTNGNPLVMLDGKVTNNYTALFASNLSNLKYMGPMNPPVFGSIRNTFEWRQVSLSFLVSYKFGYYFRRPSIQYYTLFSSSGSSRYYPDYEYRWRKPGDEAFTNVPSMIYPADLSRDAAYTFSEILVEKGDHIRLQDIQLSYDLNRHQIRKLPFQSARFYVYINNIGILWRANDHNIDPDFVPVAGFFLYPNSRTVSFGIKIDY